MIKITRKSTLTGVERTFYFPISEAQLTAWQDGELIQKVMPQLSAAEREFILTGSTPEEWDAAFPEVE